MLMNQCNIYIKLNMNQDIYSLQYQKINMFSSSKKNQNYSDINSGQTLFGFLKRRKTFALENLLSKSRRNNKYHQDESNIHTTANKSFKSMKKQQSNKDQFDYIHCVTSRQKNKRDQYQSHSKTPRLVTFKQEQQGGSTNRSFIQMISPIKVNSRRRGLLNSSLEKAQKSIRQNRPQPIQKSKNNKRILDNDIKIIQDTLHELMDSGKNFKEKAHCLFIQMKPFMQFLSSNVTEKGLKKKLESLKDRLRIFQLNLKKFEVSNSHEIIQRFKITLQQHIDCLQAHIRSQYEKKTISDFSHIESEKKMIISQLQDKLRTQERNNEVNCLKIQKLQKQIRLKGQKMNDIQQKNLRRQGQRLEKYNQKLNYLQEKIQQMNIQIGKLQQENKNLSKSIKDVQFTKQELEKRFSLEKQLIIGNKETYLINQISMLKQQFAKDMEQLDYVHKTKEEQFIKNVAILKQQKLNLVQIISTYKADKLSLAKQIQAKQSVLTSLSKKNECLITDMHRMNEQLYQHWLALSDIKQLSKRLGIYDRFSKIYTDLVFNQDLFQ